MMKVKIGGRSVTALEFVAAVRKKGVEFQAHHSGRIVLHGPGEEVRKARVLLGSSPTLEALLILEAAKEVPFIADLLEEREAILAADGLKADALSVALALVGPGAPEDVETETKKG